jgi:hypothetical protein
MAKSLVLSIGDPKTGTSSIQEVLRFGRWESPSVTLAYPEQLNSFPLANALSDPRQADRRAARWGRLAEWLHASDADVAVVSAEQFYRVDPEVLLAALNEFLPDYVEGLRVIAYVRPHAPRLISAYMQRCKAGVFRGDMAAFFKWSQGEHLLHYAARFQHWRDTFGDRFTLRPMIREHLREQDVVSDFLHYALRGAPFTLHGTVEANPSLPLEFLAGLAEVQGVLRRNGIPLATRHTVGDYVGRALMQTRRGAGTRLKMSRSLYLELKAYCQSDADALDQGFFGSPVMKQALEDALKDTLPSPQSTKASAHYPDEVIEVLRQKTRAVVAMFNKRPLAWTVAFEREIGQRLPTPGKARPSKALRADIEGVNAALTEIAGLIGGDHGIRAG